MKLKIVPFDDATTQELCVAARFAGGDEHHAIALIIEKPFATAFDNQPLQDFLYAAGYNAIQIDLNNRINANNADGWFDIDTAMPVEQHA